MDVVIFSQISYVVGVFQVYGQWFFYYYMNVVWCVVFYYFQVVVNGVECCYCFGLLSFYYFFKCIVYNVYVIVVLFIVVFGQFLIGFYDVNNLDVIMIGVVKNLVNVGVYQVYDVYLKWCLICC